MIIWHKHMFITHKHRSLFPIVVINTTMNIYVRWNHLYRRCKPSVCQNQLSIVATWLFQLFCLIENCICLTGHIPSYGSIIYWTWNVLRNYIYLWPIFIHCVCFADKNQQSIAPYIYQDKLQNHILYGPYIVWFPWKFSV